MDKVKNLTDIEHIKIFMDQKRQDILQILRGNKVPMTAKQIAGALNMNPATINFHTNKLVSIGVLIVARTEIIHGIVAKYLEPAAEFYKIIATESDKAAFKLIKNKLNARAELLFDKGKQDYMVNCSKKNTIYKPISYTELYMTLEELEQFSSRHQKFVSEHSGKTSPEQIRFRVFLSCVSDDEELQKGKPCC